MNAARYRKYRQNRTRFPELEERAWLLLWRTYGLRRVLRARDLKVSPPHLSGLVRGFAFPGRARPARVPLLLVAVADPHSRARTMARLRALPALAEFLGNGHRAELWCWRRQGRRQSLRRGRRRGYGR